MPVKFSGKNKAETFLSYLKVSSEDIATLMEKFDINLMSNGIIFTNEEGEEAGNFGMPMAFATGIQKQTLNAKQYKQACDGLASIIPKLVADNDVILVSHDEEPMGIYPVADMKSGDCVKLRDANLLYQPVFGTSEGSRYFCVAASANLKVAARWSSPATLSIRVEGFSLAAHVKTLKAAGFTYTHEKDYASVHLQCEDKQIAYKALGALLFAIGVKFDTPMCEPKYIIG